MLMKVLNTRTVLFEFQLPQIVYVQHKITTNSRNAILFVGVCIQRS